MEDSITMEHMFDDLWKLVAALVVIVFFIGVGIGALVMSAL